MQLIGIEPIIIFQVVSSVTTSHFAKQEMSETETAGFVNVTVGSGESIVEALRDQIVAAGVSEIGSYNLSNSERGFGSVGSLTATFLDYNGLFKEMLENVNIYDLEVNILLYLRQNVPGVSTQQDQCKLVMRGKFQTPIEWSEGNRTFQATIVSNVLFKEFGFAPEFETIDHIRENLVDGNWPHMFGEVSNFGLHPLCTVPTCSVNKDYYFLRNMLERETNDPEVIVPGGFPQYPDTSESIFINFRSLVTIQCSESVNMPPSYPGEDLYCEIEIDGGSVLARGDFIGSSFQVNEWNIPWYEKICIWGPPQHNSFIPFQQDDTAYIPNTIEMLGYGTFTIPAPPEDPNWSFNIYDELIDVLDVEVPFPIVDAAAGWAQNNNTPWLKGMFIECYAVKIIQDFNTGAPTVQLTTMWAKVVHQEAFTLYLDDVRDENGQEYSLSGYRPMFIIRALKNKVFKPPPNSTELIDAPPIYTQKSQTHKEFFLDRGIIDSSLAGYKDLALKLPKGAKVQAVDWWGSRMYPLTLDTDTWVSEVYARIGKSLVGMDEASQFALMKFIKIYDGELAIGGTWWWWYLGGWVDANSANTPLPLELRIWATAHSEDEDFEYWPDEFMFIMLYPGSFNQMLLEYSDADAIRLLVSCENAYNTDEKMFKYLLEKYTTGYVGYINIANENTVGLGVTRSSDSGVMDYLAQIAEEEAKAIRIDGPDVTLTDLLDIDPTIAFEFTEKFIEQRSLIISYTETSDIINIVKSTGTWTYGTYSIKNKESIARHSELQASYEYEINRILSTYTPGSELEPGDPANEGWDGRGYNHVLAYWLWRMSNTWMYVSFNTYLEAAHLVPGDIVFLNLTQELEVSEAARTGVLRYPLQSSDNSLPNGNGIVIEATLDPETWTVSIALLMKIKLGEG